MYLKLLNTNTMDKKSKPLKDVFDDAVLTKIVFVRKDGKLAMARKRMRVEPTEDARKPLFPISKERK